ncbi:MAG: type II toxin-antitoxin system RelE/ParE family toxin [Hydrogenophilaceae bacterium]|jgi:plasmid stabilization system protein ParE|nr:type II toxin-antitoxin system RelE/ParE family toxin [Hydrogenophilaceae bacterium]
MRRLVIEPPARADIKAIRAYSRRAFGSGAQQKYGALMRRAFVLLCADPERAGAQRREDLPRAPYVFHLRHARTRGAAPKTARHFIIFTFDEAALTVLRVLHDSMDVPQRLGDD